MKPGVSLIVRTHGNMKELQTSLESLAAQTFREMEIIFLSRGLSDDDKKDIGEWRKKLSDGLFLKEKRFPENRNEETEVLQEAAGEYIAFVESGEFADPSCFLRLYNEAVRKKAQIACCGITEVGKYRIIKRKIQVQASDETELRIACVLARLDGFAGGVIFQRSFWMEQGFSFLNDELKAESLYKAMIEADQIASVSEPLYGRRKEEKAKDAASRKLNCLLRGADFLADICEEQKSMEFRGKLAAGLINTAESEKVVHDWKCLGRKERLETVQRMNSIFDKLFPGWRKLQGLRIPSGSGRNRHGKTRVQDVVCTRLAAGLPDCIIRAWDKSVWFARKVLGKLQKKKERENEKKRQRIQAEGLAVLAETQALLKSIGVKSFADFGTCLGLVREGRLLKHDTDMDLGVEADEEQRILIHAELENHGYQLWRQYVFQGQPVEESYYYKGIKIDFNYYVLTKERAITWLFYKKPGYTYPNKNIRHIVQMEYRPIDRLQIRRFGDYEISLPEDAENLLEQKYGTNWRVPDKGWIYWKSPAAHPLEQQGYFVLYEYSWI